MRFLGILMVMEILTLLLSMIMVLAQPEFTRLTHQTAHSLLIQDRAAGGVRLTMIWATHILRFRASLILTLMRILPCFIVIPPVILKFTCLLPREVGFPDRKFGGTQVDIQLVGLLGLLPADLMVILLLTWPLFTITAAVRAESTFLPLPEATFLMRGPVAGGTFLLGTLLPE